MSSRKRILPEYKMDDDRPPTKAERKRLQEMIELLDQDEHGNYYWSEHVNPDEYYRIAYMCKNIQNIRPKMPHNASNRPRKTRSTAKQPIPSSKTAEIAKRRNPPRSRSGSTPIEKAVKDGKSNDNVQSKTECDYNSATSDESAAVVPSRKLRSSTRKPIASSQNLGIADVDSVSIIPCEEVKASELTHAKQIQSDLKLSAQQLRWAKARKSLPELSRHGIQNPGQPRLTDQQR